MAQLKETYACVPSTERGRGILISGDPKSNSILYCNGRSVIIMNLDRPLEVSVYAEHAYQATVARFSPNSEWVASADVSGSVRIWGTRNEHVLKKEFRVLSGRIDDLQWSPDGLRIVASGEGKGKSFVRAFICYPAAAALTATCKRPSLPLAPPSEAAIGRRWSLPVVALCLLPLLSFLSLLSQSKP
ncbi:hypothetical protein RJ639_040832 [Escallonia herrerae]|uniref:Uncharacterized protein n=1 Tax=Escallonia herrerae TaxID=1293975 RepID=A0AA88WHC4_9ASTE|nr:hypothetical protein RJ639_040832 [Escallonia herrerae]